MVFIKEYVIAKFCPDMKDDPESVYKIVMSVNDADHDGTLSFEEFKAMLIDKVEEPAKQTEQT